MDYKKEFPNESDRNAAHSDRANVALWGGGWGQFLDRISELKDHGGAEFHNQIVDELSSIFNKQDDDSLRATLLDEILTRPKGRELPKSYHNSGCLPYLKDYLVE